MAQGDSQAHPENFYQHESVLQVLGLRPPPMLWHSKIVQSGSVRSSCYFRLFQSLCGAPPSPHRISPRWHCLRRANPLPASRSVDGTDNGTASKKRGRDDGDSSDEENGNSGGAYSNQFRSRQRSRLSAN